MDIQRPKAKQIMPENTELVFKGEIFSVYQWQQLGYDGKVRTFERLKRADTVVIIPVTADGQILLIKDEQPGKEAAILCPGGRVDEGENVLDAAKRELLEETGYEGEEWTLFDAVQPSTKIEWAVYTFIAKVCKKVGEQELDGAEKIEVLPVDIEKFMEIITSDDQRDNELKIKFLQAKLDLEKMKELRAKLGV